MYSHVLLKAESYVLFTTGLKSLPSNRASAAFTHKGNTGLHGKHTQVYLNGTDTHDHTFTVHSIQKQRN
uniref:Uncharacterized protein n=1 Tax=Anguilla anguilla TaxID=7936 RepID=A0A0E9QTM3_ANGAN